MDWESCARKVTHLSTILALGGVVSDVSWVLASDLSHLCLCLIADFESFFQFWTSFVKIIMQH